MRSLLVAVTLVGLVVVQGGCAVAGRRVIDLSGRWQVAEGTLAEPPAAFDRRAPVPGLADMADPPFENVGAVPEDPRDPSVQPSDPKREAFWYRRTFTLDGPVPAVARLKVHKAKFGTRVLLNGKRVGEHVPCFTPGWFDVRPHLKGEGAKNVLLVRVGASPAAVPAEVPWGFDFEKIRYLPGIYDRVELVLSGTPHVVNVQVVPNVAQKAARVVAEVANASNADADVSLRVTVREVASGKEVGQIVAKAFTLKAGGSDRVDVTLPIDGCRLWSPEAPFLYRVRVETGADVYEERFGMRSFTFDAETGRALLNGEPYYLRGSNVCFFRFTEDPNRGGKGWDEAWVRRLHRQFKSMHWNALRYCIGLVPEMWYEIADEEGFLIQDEFPIWYLGKWPGEPKADQLAAEYREWMRERWNHPCVVIWDAQNETAGQGGVETRQAIGRVRDLDLSHRPWDNGWGTPHAPGDLSETHPYRTNRKGFTLAKVFGENGIPNNGPRQGAGKPYLINEYAWLWLHRDSGKPTRLTQKAYDTVLGPGTYPEAVYRETYARYLAALTEFWRARRQCAGVLHFCGLGHARPDGYTSDNFLALDTLEYDPHFLKYVRDAFAPVGVWLDFAEPTLAADAGTRSVPVGVINDLKEPWTGTVVLVLSRADGDEHVWREAKQGARLGPCGKARFEFTVPMPKEAGSYRLTAELHTVNGQVIRSLRDFDVAE